MELLWVPIVMTKELLNGIDFDADGQSSCDGDCNDRSDSVFWSRLAEFLSDCMRDIDGDGCGDHLALPPGVLERIVMMRGTD